MINIVVNNNNFKGVKFGKYYLDRDININEWEYATIEPEEREKLANLSTNNIITVSRDGIILNPLLVASGSFSGNTSDKGMVNPDIVSNLQNELKVFKSSFETLTKKVEGLTALTIKVDDLEKQIKDLVKQLE